MVVDLEQIKEKEESVTVIGFKQIPEDLDSYAQKYIDDGFDYEGMTYSRDRSMLTHDGKVMRKYTKADLHEIEAILKSKDIRAKDIYKDIYQDLVLCVLPNKTHLLSILMDYQESIVSILESLTAKFQDPDFDHEDERILEDRFNEKYDDKFK